MHCTYIMAVLKSFPANSKLRWCGGVVQVYVSVASLLTCQGMSHLCLTESTVLPKERKTSDFHQPQALLPFAKQRKIYEIHCFCF